VIEPLPAFAPIDPARGFCLALLRVGTGIDHRTVLRAVIIALAHALDRVVVFPEHFQELALGDFPRVKHDQHEFGLAGPAGADFLVAPVGRLAARIADRGGPYAGLLPELALGAPEAAEAEGGDFQPLRKEGFDRGPWFTKCCLGLQLASSGRQGFAGLGKLALPADGDAIIL